MFAGVVLVMGGIALANSQGWFSDSPESVEGVKSCDEVVDKSTLREEFHEHARLEVYLNSDTPYDFSRERYQQAASFVHFERGAQDANGAQIHVHASRPTLGCLFETLDWTVGPDRIVTDTGEEYVVDEDHKLDILLDGEPAPRGWNQPIVGGSPFVVEFAPVDSGSSDDGNQSTNGTAAR
jgi:hypothetical protein